ncbi:hypothetical protein FB561_0754 [Kribbella amoyensis]|uniref:Immunity protein 50 of polymorphic toxin system n=1 Tax=Kribbella amoyensis TaxID=996641 RepID=A0A561BLC4_9ACTN|nr:hypothetical protein [Kribbella amoyensis]TWD79690.1 hypothetical protein FB561_0754 [Kribbella amoyensis]
MKFIEIEEIDGGYFLDPRKYLQELKLIGPDLPPGARRFAQDADHYDFAASKCVKDLTLSSVSISGGNGSLSAEVEFAPNKFKHESGLSVRYWGLVNLMVEVSPEAGGSGVRSETVRLGDVQLDEILPHESGCAHEIAFTGGVIRIVSADLVAEWRLAGE